MDIDLRRFADDNGGYLHREDLLAVGESDTTIRAALRAGVLRRIRVGSFVFADCYEELDPIARHLVLARSVIDKFETGAVALSHQSAAAAFGMALYDVDLDTVHLTRLDGGAARQESGVHHHRAVPGYEIASVDGGRLCVSPVLATWQIACRNSRRSGLVTMDSVLHHDLAPVAELVDIGGRFRHWAGGRAARLTVRLVDPGAESAPETLYRFACIENGLPRPVTQYVVEDVDGHFIARTDLGFPDHAHVAEMDGVSKYVRHLRDGETPADVVVREKIREDRIREQGYGVSRALYRDVQPAAAKLCAARLRRDLELSASVHRRARRHIV